MTHRRAHIYRETSESTVDVAIDLDGAGESTISTGVGFYDHMLTTLSKHSGIDMTITTTGDVEIDGHHSIEDTAIALGQALAQAWGINAVSRVLVTPWFPSTRPLPSALLTLLDDRGWRARVSPRGRRTFVLVVLACPTRVR
ncbi:imidazoleglycerol-phosphate dehydratase [Cutibacterium acnes JCM 18918]|nr:imidazoleglycerol-phosphate dehydratase [Cutibacterium acnes JCM 18918]